MTSWGSPTPPSAPGMSPVPPGPGAAPTPPGHGHHGRRDDSWIGGLVLIGIGFAFLAGQIVPDGGRYIVLIVGLALLAGGIATREYGLVVPGGIVTGVGVGILLQAAVSDDGNGGGGFFLLSLGLGFISIWVVSSLLRLRENNPWPFIPGLILTSLGAIAFAGTRYADVARFGWPVILIGLGVIVVFREFGRRSGA